MKRLRHLDLLRGREREANSNSVLVGRHEILSVLDLADGHWSPSHISAESPAANTWLLMRIDNLTAMSLPWPHFNPQHMSAS